MAQSIRRPEDKVEFVFNIRAVVGMSLTPPSRGSGIDVNRVYFCTYARPTNRNNTIHHPAS